MKILNLFAGLGGNRIAWGKKHQVTAVESNQQVAYIYQLKFPNDIVIIGDAYDYLKEHFPFFDLIWLSPPCKSHTKLVKFSIQRKFEKGYAEKLKFPDFKLYEVIVFLDENYKGLWIVENVKPYYKPLIKPTVELGRHYLWTNIQIKPKKFDIKEYFTDIENTAKVKQVDLKFMKQFKSPHFRLDGILRDMVNPEIAKYIMKHVENDPKTIESVVNQKKIIQKSLF